MTLVFQTFALIVHLLAANGIPAQAESLPSISRTFAQLQAEDTTDLATEEFLKMGHDNAALRAYLAEHLPPLILQEPEAKPHVWLNSVRLAGAFQLTAATPSLAKCIGVSSGSAGGGTLSEVQRLDPFPAGKALSQIGEPAIPTLVRILDKGNHREKWVAYRALFLIGTPRAKKELRDHLSREPDQAFMLEIQKALDTN